MPRRSPGRTRRGTGERPSLPLGTVDGGEDGPQGGQVDVVGQAHAPVLPAVPLVPEEDVGHALGVGAIGDGVGGVVQEGETGHFLPFNGVEEGVDGAVSVTRDLKDGVGVLKGAPEGDVGVAVCVHTLLEGVLEQLVGLLHVHILLVEELVDPLRGDFGAHGVGLPLNDGAELRVHLLGQVKAEVVVHDIGRASLARLGVDADDGLVLPAHVGGVNGQIGDLPEIGVGLLHVLGALVDGVLMAAGESGEYQLSGVGLPVAHRHLGTPLEHLADLIDVGKVKPGVHPLGVHIHGQGDDVHVSGALAVAEQGGLHPVRAGQQAHFSSGHAAAPVVVGVQGDDGAVPAGDLFAEVLQHIGELVGHTVFHRGGQVQNDLVLRVGVEVLQHRLADLHRVVHLGAHEGLRGVLKAQVHPLLNEGLGHLIDQVGGIGGDLGDAGGVHVEHHLPLEGGGGVVEVENDVLGAPDGLEGLFDEMLPGLDQHLDGHVIGDVPPLDELPADLVLRLTGGGEADLDLLDAHIHQGVEVFQLLLKIHGVHQGLVAVPQVHRAPHGSLGDDLVGPGAAHDLLGLEGNVFFVAWIHGRCPPKMTCSAEVGGGPDRIRGMKKRP